MQKLSLIILAVILQSCVSFKPAVKRDYVRTAVIQKDFDKTWASVVRVFASENITFKSMDKASGLIATDVKNFLPFSNGGTIDCGTLTGMSLTSEKGFALYNVFIEKEDKGTRVTINVKPIMTTYAQNGQSLDRDCYSTGLFEKEFFDKIK